MTSCSAMYPTLARPLRVKAPLGHGLLPTLELTVICIVLGTALGFLTSLARTSKGRALRALSTAYVEFFRGTPVLIQMFWFFFCLPLILGTDLSNLTCGVVALTLYMGAITSETFRAALNFVGREQYDACIALGLPYRTQVLHVVLPQAILRATPTLLSNTVSLFKESALVSAVGMADLMYVGQNISNRTGHPVEMLTTVAAIYFAIAFPLTRAVSLLEARVLRTLAV